MSNIVKYNFSKCGFKGAWAVTVDTKWHFKFFAKYDYRFQSDAIITIIETFFYLSDNRFFAIITNCFVYAIIAAIVVIAIISV
jgi:hypothetical protein